MLDQVLTKATPFFEKAFPGHIDVFALDNSSGEACKAPDTLVTSRINLGPGGKQPKMHPKITPQYLVQSMVYQNGDTDWDTAVPISTDLVEMPKGLK